MVRGNHALRQFAFIVFTIAVRRRKVKVIKERVEYRILETESQAISDRFCFFILVRDSPLSLFRGRTISMGVVVVVPIPLILINFIN
jgi:hypothetical protein